MRHNGDRRADEILADIERTRSDVDVTLQAIERKLTPGQLVDQGLDYLRHSSAREFTSNLGDSVKGNPLPIALVGIGLAWLMAASRSDATRRADLAPASPDERVGLEERAGDTLESASEAAGSARERIGETMDRASRAAGSARDRISESAHAARERASRIGQSARHQLDRTRSGYDHMLREQPLAIGAIGLAVGAVLAAALPRTREEDRLMGPARDRLAEQAGDLAGEQLHRTRRMADTATHAEDERDQRDSVVPPEPSMAGSAPPFTPGMR